MATFSFVNGKLIRKEREPEDLLRAIRDSGHEDWRFQFTNGQLIRKVKDAEGHEHASDSGQFTSSGGSGGKDKPKGKPKKGKPPAHGDRAAAVRAKHEEHKKHRAEMFAAVKADAEAEKGKADEQEGKLRDNVNNVSSISDFEEPEQPESEVFGTQYENEGKPKRTDYDNDEDFKAESEQWQAEKEANDAWEKEHAEWEDQQPHYEELSEAFSELDELHSQDSDTPSEQFQKFKDMEEHAKNALAANKKIKPGTGDSVLTADELVENKKRLAAIITICRQGRDHLRTYSRHRKEMKEIKETR